jgi:TolB-like protein/DNA-binding winged helix-turn-helix (wHTH) protein/Flp pilus assembly protein TadD
MPLSFKDLYRFDEFTLDPPKRAFARNGTPVTISPKAFEVLTYLVANPGRVVTKEELLSAVWPDSFVEESNLAQHISWLRKALGDRANCIVTVPGRGYQFTAAVRAEAPGEGNDDRLPGRRAGDGAAATMAQSTPSAMPGPAPNHPRDSEVSSNGQHAGAPPTDTPIVPANPPTARQTRNWKTVQSAAAAAMVLLAAFYLLYEKFGGARFQAPVSVAVLPFANLTGDPGKEYVSDGVTEEIIGGLARVQGGKLRVIARTSSMSYKSTNKAVKEIAKELGVQYVLEGSVQSEGNHVHVTAQLIRGDDQTNFWADSFDGNADQILEFEDRLTSSVAQSLSLTLLAGKSPKPTAVSYAAHDAYLKGLYALAKRSKNGFESALQSFGSAVALDPQYARAYAELAVTYNLMGQFGWMSTSQAHSQARAAALQAIAADPDLAEAHAALGFDTWFYEWNPGAAEKELSRAIELEPTNVDALHWYALVLMTSGRLPQAEKQMRAALALDPKALILRTNLGWIHYTARQYPQAIAEMQAVVKDDPNFLTAHYKLWWAYSLTGDVPRAMKELETLGLLLFDEESEKTLADAYAKEGYPAALQEFLVENQRHPSYPYLLVDDARRMCFAGDKAGALQRLQQAVDNREGWMIVVESDPAFDGLRGAPEYAKVIQKLHALSAQAQ